MALSTGSKAVLVAIDDDRVVDSGAEAKGHQTAAKEIPVPGKHKDHEREHGPKEDVIGAGSHTDSVARLVA